jgi:hypothetical protein
VTESAPGVKTVDAARFNGLMGKFNQTQSALDEARRRIAELEAATPAKEEPAVSDTSAVSALESKVNSLTELLLQERLESAKAQAIKDFPGASAFADLIIADSPEAVRDMAKVLHERVQGAKPAVDDGEGEAPPAAPAAVEAPAPAPVVPVVAGGVSIETPTADPEGDVVKAIKERSFSDFLRAKWTADHGGEDPDLVL